MTEDLLFDESGLHSTVVCSSNPVFTEPLPSDLEQLISERVESEINIAIWESVSRFASAILEHRNPRLTVISFCFASGMPLLQGKSQTQLAAECGVTRAALSARIVKITKALGLPPSRGMKSIQARNAYSDAQHAYNANKNNYP